MQTMVAKKLLKNLLKNTDLEGDEIRGSLMLYEENNEVFLVSVTLRINSDGKLEVSRVLQNVNVDDAL